MPQAYGRFPSRRTVKYEWTSVSYMDGVVFVAETPALDKPCALMVEACKPDHIALAMIYGVFQAKVQMQNPDDKFARVVDGDVTCLESASSGPFSILWSMGEDMAHCFVQFPAASPAVEGQRGNYVPPHSHYDHDSGGLSVACYSSGTSVPAKPW